MQVELMEAELLNLPPDQRSRIFDRRLDRLLVSLDRDPGWEQDWLAEVDRREAAISAGHSAWQPGEEVVARLQATLK